MSRPEPTTGTVSGPVYFSDGSTPLNVDAIARLISKTDGSVGAEGPVIDGAYKLESPAGEFMLKIINSDIEIGSIDITITIGVSLEGQNVITNKGLGR